MPHSLTGIDHTLIGVNDLEAARIQFQKLGFILTPRGSHIGWGTANYCIMFENDYLELLGIVDPALETNGLEAALATDGEGLLGLALASSDPHGTYTSLQEAGLDPSEILDLKRKLELSEGEVLPRFKLIRIAAEGLTDKQIFICHHLTPELLRRSEWLVHPNGAKYISSLVFVVENPKSLTDYYRRLLGSINVTLTDDTLSVRIGEANLVFVNDQDLDLLFPGLSHTKEMPELPHPFAMTIGVEDLEETGHYIKGQGVATRKIANGSLRVDPEDACGVLLEFVKT